MYIFFGVAVLHAVNIVTQINGKASNCTKCYSKQHPPLSLVQVHNLTTDSMQLLVPNVMYRITRIICW